MVEDRRRFVEYKAPDLPPNVRPASAPASVTLAMDSRSNAIEPGHMALDSAGGVFGWLNQYNSLGCGLFFPGYPYLAELTQISEYRAPAETVSTEMTRKWVEIISKGGGDKSDKIAEITERMEELKVRDMFRRAALLDGEFGRAQIIFNFKGQTDDASRQLPLTIDSTGVKKGSLESIQCIEPYWSTPFSWNAMYPERADFYKPTSWYIMGRKTHTTRLLTFIAREVPDILKPSYNFGGISLSQLMQPYVDFWLRTRKSVNDLIRNFSITVLATDLSTTIQEGGDGSSLVARATLFTQNRDNQGLMLVNKDSEEIVKVNTPLSGLGELQAQAQEHMAAPAHIPLIKLFGVVPTGLNATGEGEIQVWYDHVHAMQENLYGPNFEIMLKVVQLDLYGAIDDDITSRWVPLDEPTQKELSEIRASDATAGTGYINAGVVSAEEERERLQNDPLSGYDNLSGPAPEIEEPEMPEDNTGDLAEMGNEHESGEADKQRDHEAEQADLDRKHEAKLAKSKSVTGDAELTGGSGSNSAMDRKYPSYTLADLEKMVAEGRGNAVMEQEIADRKSGVSAVKTTPQILGGKAQVRLGRM